MKDIDSSTPPDPPSPNPQAYDVEDSGPHTFYTVLDTPFEPWYSGGEVNHPWVTALEFVINGLSTLTISDKPNAAKHTVIGIWLRAIPSYDHDQTVAQARYVPDEYPRKFTGQDEKDGKTVIEGEPNSEKALKFRLTAFINGAFPDGDCFDVASAVQTCGNILGLQGRFASLSTFGYLNPTLFISQLNWLGPQINNPFYLRPPFDRKLGVSPVKLTGLDYLDEDVNPVDSLRDRTLFFTHTYVIRAGTVLDATIGEYDGSVSEADYLASARDTSTKGEAKQESPVSKRKFFSILYIE